MLFVGREADVVRGALHQRDGRHVSPSPYGEEKDMEEDRCMYLHVTCIPLPIWGGGYR
jgi:hypothetical protein